jgi:enterochelin esterase family protein
MILTPAAVAAAVLATLPTLAPAQPNRPKGPAVVSPEVKADRSVTFRVLAPKAEAVTLTAGDIPGGQQPRRLAKGEEGVWELTLGPVDPGTYRYTFNVDGVATVDPRNPAASESNGNVWSVVHVPGSETADNRDVPHGAVAKVFYRSTALGRDRRMHVYTPPGYAAGADKYPVLYLLHGSSDSDDSWVSVGRANFILDNLIATKKAEPMLVVMPAGHVGPTGVRATPTGGRFEDDFERDIRPYVEKNYRVRTDRASRAVAGLSMGGAQTLSLFAAKPADYGYVGVFSSAVLFGKADDWEKQHKETLAGGKDGLKLFWFATGKDDFLLARTKETVGLFQRLGFTPEFQETPGGHTWIVWRKYLAEFTPQLFR